jgi:hypothetical protein
LTIIAAEMRLVQFAFAGQRSRRSASSTAVSNDLQPRSLIPLCLSLHALMLKRLNPWPLVKQPVTSSFRCAGKERGARPHRGTITSTSPSIHECELARAPLDESFPALQPAYANPQSPAAKQVFAPCSQTKSLSC